MCVRNLILAALAFAAPLALGRGTDGFVCNAGPNFGCRVEKLSPYDAEVEFIENVGESFLYITNNSVFAGRKFAADFEVSELRLQVIFGSWGDRNTRDYGQYQFVQSTYRWQYDGLPTWQIDVDHPEVGKRTTVVAKKYYTTTDKYGPSIFARTNDSANGIASEDGSYHNHFVLMKLYSFAIFDESETKIFDLVPVRFTNESRKREGAMYDRVSGQLFRNQGTGAFVIGPDKH